MLQVRKILFPTDFSACAESAFSHATHLAQRYGAELHVLYVAIPYEEDPSNPMEYYDLEKEDVVTWSDANMAAETRDELRLIHAQVRVVSPAMGILGYAEDHDIDLVVMGTHGRRGLDRLLIGSVAEEVVRTASCPVMTVRAADGEAAPSEAVDRILVPVDYSLSSELTVTYAKELAASYGAGVQLLHIIQEAVLPTTYGVEPVAVGVPEVVERSRQALREIAAAAPGADVALEEHVLIGNPARDIVDFAAEAGADLIVVSTHGLTGIKRLLLGSVTEKVVRMAPCPVFTVKSYGKSLLPEDVYQAVTAAR